jgi:two-component system, NtrC family, response regulator AtoC
MPRLVDTFEFLGATAVVASPRMRQVLEFVQRAARSTATVLITGESGSGKEVIARALHHLSMRCARPWVDVSCGALPEHLMESELFGYDKGAFSGAESSKPGLFEMAHTGTLFLDEIGELEPRMQVKLLRVLDGTPYYRLGGTRKIMVDVRVLAATNQDLEALVRQGKFRADLFHRLCQVRVQAPPLRERREDIVPLAEYFLERQAPGVRLSEAAELTLENHAWPGNVRELRNLLIRAALSAQDDLIQVNDLGLGHVEFHPLPVTPLVRVETPVRDLEGLERQTILRALDETGGHRQRAAARLGISRRTLSRKLKAYGVRDPEPEPDMTAAAL